MSALGAPRVSPARLVPAAVLAGAAAAGGVAAIGHGGVPSFVRVAAVGVLLVAGAYLVWQTDPTWTILGAFALSPLASHWPDMGIPGALSPHRFLLAAATVAIIFRAPSIRERPRLPIKAAHWALLIASLYVVCSSVAAGTLTNKDDIFRLLEAYGLLLFVLFLVAPVAFRSPSRRSLLMGFFVATGAYLGLTALFETVHLTALVFPRYINNKSVGTHFGRARGPFTEAVVNGTAMYACAAVSVMAVRFWRGRAARLTAAAVVVLCGMGILFCLQRSVWLGSIVATIVVCLSQRALRRHLVTALVALALVGGAAYAIVPHSTFEARSHDQSTIWDRDNLNRTAITMIKARPLLGFGWGTFQTASVKGDYYHQADTYPLGAVGFAIHDVYLSNGTELGLVGLTLWLVAVLMAAAMALSAPAPTPELKAWKTVFLAYAVFFVIVEGFVPTSYYPNFVFWLLAGVASTGWLPSRRRVAA